MDFLNGLKQKYPRLQMEMVDFGDGGEGAKRWQASGYKCMTIEINGSPYAGFPEKGTEATVAFKMPVGFYWTHEELEAAVQAALAGQLQPATEEEAKAAQPPAPVKAEIAVKEITEEGKKLAQVTMNKNEAFVIAASASGKSPKARAEAAAEALQTWLANPVKPSDLTARKVAGGWAVMGGDKQLLVATEADAKAARTTVEGVAKKWASGLRQGLVAAARAPETSQNPGEEPASRDRGASPTS